MDRRDIFDRLKNRKKRKATVSNLVVLGPETRTKIEARKRRLANLKRGSEQDPVTRHAEERDEASTDIDSSKGESAVIIAQKALYLRGSIKYPSSILGAYNPQESISLFRQK